MIIGRPEQIAVEYADLRKEDNGYVTGRMRLLAKDTPIGDFDRYVLMNGVVVWLKEFIAFPGIRFHELFSGLNDKDCLEVVISGLYDINTIDLYDSAIKQQFSHMEFCPKVSPVFDGDQGIVLDLPDHSKFIYRVFGSDSVDSVAFEKSYFNDLLTQFIQCIESV